MAPTKPKLEIVASNEPAPFTAPEGPRQVEMPFAVVNGEPMTELPKDLYIPPQALEVFLEAFEGPLDLLLYLIRKQNLDILDIPLAEITRQYMSYIELMQDLQLELAGEYMVMAATLAEIKSRMLLPRPKVDAEGHEDDPRAELVKRLQEYERFKRAALDIDTLPRLERDNWAAGAELKDRKVVRVLPQVTLQEMLSAFKEVVVRSEMFSSHHVARERLSVRERMTNVLSTLERASFVEFARLFLAEEGRMGVTVTFIAILELVREGLIEIVQAEPFAPIHVRRAAENRMLRLVPKSERGAISSVSDEGDEVFAPDVEPVATAEEAVPLASDGFVDDSEDTVDDADAEIDALLADADQPEASDATEVVVSELDEHAAASSFPADAAAESTESEATAETAQIAEIGEAAEGEAAVDGDAETAESGAMVDADAETAEGEAAVDGHADTETTPPDEGRS